MSEEKGGQTLYINDLYEADDEIPAHPENCYEIADGVVAKIRRPTIGLQERFEALDEELDDVYAKIKERGDAEDRLKEGKLEESDLPEGVTIREVQKRTRDVAVKQAFEVLDLDGREVRREEVFGPMAVVVRGHFFSLSSGIRTSLTRSSTADEAP